MKRFSFFTISLITLLSFRAFSQQSFIRTAEIPPVYGLYGDIVAGMDWDGDGKVELYCVNSNAVDREFELEARIWKYELNGDTWDSVWGAVLTIPCQNTWPDLITGDIDNDGKPELIWGPINFLDFESRPNPNPDRIIIFEAKGDGSDIMGVDDGFGAYTPNAVYKITDQNNFDISVAGLTLHDVDNDGTQEIIVSNRSAGVANWHYGVISVSDIPDNGLGTETWTLEKVGNEPILGSSGKWDIAVLNHMFYIFGSDGLVYPIKYHDGIYEALPPQNIADGKGSFRSVQTVDIDKDGTKELIFAGWLNGTRAVPTVYVCKQSGDTLISYRIADLTSLGAGQRLTGGAVGDLDGDGYMDFVCGARVPSNPNAGVYRIAYRGGDITQDTSYEISIIDSLAIYVGDDIDVITIANVDGDPEDEVLYSAAYTRGQAQDSMMAIIILDRHFTPLSIQANNNKIPSGFYLGQNYPNPFNPSTSIKFGLTNDALVSLKIYDILGREVATIISNERMKAGEYTYAFNASRLSSGTYLYKLNFDNSSLVGKMTFMK